MHSIPYAFSRFHRGIEHRFFASKGRRIAFYQIAHTVYSVLAGGFEIALILRLSGSVERIAVLNLFSYILLYACFALGLGMVRNGKAERGFRIDLAVQCFAGLYMMLNFSRLESPLVLAGFFVLKGVSEGMFWSTRHSALLHAVSDKQRDRWVLTVQTITTILNVTLPILSGFVITYLVIPTGDSVLPSGYFPVYGLCALFALAALVVSPRVRIPRQRIHWKPVFALMRDPAQRDWMAYLFSSGFTTVAATMAVGILNFYVLKTEFNMGLFASWIAIVSILFFFGMRFFSRNRTLPRLALAFAGISGEFVSRLLYYFFMNIPGLIAKSVVDSLIVPLRSMFGENIMRQRIEKTSVAKNMSLAEVLMFQETGLLISRVAASLAIIGALAIFSSDPVSVARVILLVFMAAGFIDIIFMRLVNKNNRK